MNSGAPWSTAPRSTAPWSAAQGPAATLASAPDGPGPAPIRNARQLLDHGQAGLRRVVLEVIAAGLEAADPGRAVRRAVRLDGRFLRVGARSFDLDAARSVVVLGAGKASVPIAAALEDLLGDRISRGLIVRRRGAAGGLRRIELIDADHPEPSPASLAAGQRLAALAAELGPGDLVITAFTGGSSSLACLPPAGVPFEAKQHLHAVLLRSGASIAEINAVRKHVSAVKGGRLAARLTGATIVNLTVSDVVGDAVDLLCDPAVQDTTDAAAATGVLRRYGLWSQVAPEVRAHLAGPDAQSPALAGADVTTTVLINGASVLRGMAGRVRALGWRPVLLGSAIEGDAASLGGFLGALAAESAASDGPFAAGSVLVGAGGEATVSLRRGQAGPGRGGPSQEVALGFARAVGRGAAPGTADGTIAAAVAGAFVDSDGSDGGTEAAGGCVDATSAGRARALGVDLDDAIGRHNSAEALRLLGDLVVTGPTGTNVSDLWAVAIGSPGGQP
jgi:glycerate 2-kinase